MVRRFDVYCNGGWDGCTTYEDECKDGDYVSASDYDELAEAVRWERECEDFDRWADAMCRAWSCEWDDVVHAARDEVDRLIADCKGEG